MVAHIQSIVFQGIQTVGVDVQVHMSSGLPAFTVVGLADKAVAESRERVRSAITSLGLALPPKRITVNLAPADLIKEGSHFDLAIALGLLVTMDVVPEPDVAGMMVLGELSLDGQIRGIAGVLPAAIAAHARGLGVICPADNGAEAAWAGEELQVIAAPTLLALINHFKGTQVLETPRPVRDSGTAFAGLDLLDIAGQESAKRALEVAAAGRHNLLMSGPPGAGKSMLAKRLPGILPPMAAEEMLEISMIHSVAGLLLGGKLVDHRPFRDPHHSCSMPAMVGGGSKAKPGEVTLAHRGVLFLDELPEFSRQVLDSLRQPIENGTVTVARVQSHVTYPARFQLIAAMNPCRCGYLDDPARACNKAPRCAADYQSKLSGPLLDRFDIHIDVPAVTPYDLASDRPRESSAVVAARVRGAWEIQAKRYQNSNVRSNAEVDGEWLERIAVPDSKGKTLLDMAIEQLGLSMRGYNRVRRVARTIADLEQSDTVLNHHMAEALTYRQIGLRPVKKLAG